MDTRFFESIKNKRLLSIEETPEYIGISARTIYNQLSRNAKKPFPVRHRKIGKLIKFDIYDLNAYIDGVPFETK